MTTPSHSEIMALVAQRYPKLDAQKQTSLANAALRVLAEPQWVKLEIAPMMAVKIASARSKRTHF